MEITIAWRMTQYPTFSIMLHSKAGAEPFLTIHDCRIIDGQKGPFVSYPAKKNADGKYWNYARGSDKFNEAVLAKAMAERESAPRRPQTEAPPF